MGRCCCCQRETWLTFHHLIPRKVHRRSHFKKHYDKDQLAAGILICRQCHNGIHRFYDEMTLTRVFATPEALIADPALNEYFSWVAKQRIRTVDKGR
ncbi:hypothetical protein BFC17_12290 [Alteromonas lipolytica]|uniref:HNH domain-containing protein n=2 Tax=Alteromonas lipolytica TaxID=1856405 RepID=A0A1E8FHX4_9ALTE|nr:hypothetical protein BFC17_12290 [Alteromonas lipolytica]